MEFRWWPAVAADKTGGWRLGLKQNEKREGKYHFQGGRTVRWTAGNRLGVDAGWRVLFAFQRARPRATQAERCSGPLRVEVWSRRSPDAPFDALAPGKHEGFCTFSPSESQSDTASRQRQTNPQPHPRRPDGPLNAFRVFRVFRGSVHLVRAPRPRFIVLPCGILPKDRGRLSS